LHSGTVQNDQVIINYFFVIFCDINIPTMTDGGSVAGGRKKHKGPKKGGKRSRKGSKKKGSKKKGSRK